MTTPSRHPSKLKNFERGPAAFGANFILDPSLWRSSLVILDFFPCPDNTFWLGDFKLLSGETV